MVSVLAAQRVRAIKTEGGRKNLENQYAIEMLNITKKFPGIIANDNITLQLKKGEIHALLGENGAGKSTLMSVLFGLYQPEEGIIKKDGKVVSIKDPNDATALGIGMVHQHFKLVDVFTVLDNIILGAETTKCGFLQKKEARRKVEEISKRYGLNVDLDAKVEDITVGMQQRVEILKMLYRDNEILIFDEPTAVLTPQEIEELMATMKEFAREGKSILFISHKLNEIMEVSDRVSVLRKGKYIGTVNTSETNPQALTDMMVGHAVTLNIDRPRYENPVPRLTLQDVTCYDNEGVVRLDHVSFTAMGGEILGVAGIAGSGQRELLESIAGLYPVAEGSSIRYTPEGAPESELVGKTPMQIKKSGVALAFVPEDRLGMGLVGSMGMTGNMMLRSWKKGKGVFVNRKDPNELAMNIWKELEVVTPSTEFPVRRMSGGNVQKVLVGREIASAPNVLMSAYAVRGLDINTSYTIYNLMTEQKMKGVAVIFVGEDLDVLLELCDRILVLCGGKVSGIVDARTATKEEIGLMMTRVGGGKEEAVHA